LPCISCLSQSLLLGTQSADSDQTAQTSSGYISCWHATQCQVILHHLSVLSYFLHSSRQVMSKLEPHVLLQVHWAFSGGIRLQLAVCALFAYSSSLRRTHL
jgi:hypothetical protein